MLFRLQVERYDPRTNKWKYMKSDLREKRSGAGVAVLNKKIYVCGGHDGGDNSLDTVECYDPEYNK